MIVEITNKNGFHARPAALFVKKTKDFSCEIKFKKDEKCFNAKSILSILSMGIKKGDKIELMTSGDEALETLKALSEYLVTLEIGRLL